MSRSRILAVMMTLCCCQVAMAQEALTLTLEEAQEMALQNHPQVRANELRLNASKQDVNAAEARYLPQISFNAVQVFADDKTQIAASDGITNSSVLRRGAYGITVNQLITDFGRTGNKIEAAKADSDARSASVENAKQQVLFDVTRAFYNRLKAQTFEEVAEVTLKARNEFLERITDLRDAGRRSDLDVSIAKQDVSDAKLLALQAKNAVDDAVAVFSQALGLSEMRHFTLVGEKKALPLFRGIDAIIAQALDLNPGLQALKARAVAARKAADSEYSANYPTISAIGYAGDVPIESAGFNRSNYAAAGINLSVPIFTGGRITASGKSSAFIADSALEEVMDKENALKKDIRVAWNSVQAAYKNIEVANEFMDNASRSFDLTNSQYELGKSSVVDVARAQLAKTKAEIASINAVYEYLSQRAFLNYVAGYIISDN